MIEAPPIINLGDAPIRLAAKAELADGSVADLSGVKCSLGWSSSSADIATVTSDGIVEAKRLGDVVIRAECGRLLGEATVHVRRRVTGTVRDRQSNLPIANATVVNLSNSDAGETVTDASGRFVLSIGSGVDLKASAAGFGTTQQHISDVQTDVQFLLDQELLTFRWTGTFEGQSSPVRVPQGTLDGFEFETHSPGRVSITISAGCNTTGTYEDFGADLFNQAGQLVGFVLAYPANVTRTVSVNILPGRYKLSLSARNYYAAPGCPWELTLSRPL